MSAAGQMRAGQQGFGATASSSDHLSLWKSFLLENKAIYIMGQNFWAEGVGGGR